MEENMSKIDKTAIVHESATLGKGVEIGPFSLIGPDVTVGENTTIGPYVQLKGPLTIGKSNRIFHGACLGEIGQDMHFNNPEARIEIGDDNIIREYVTIHQPAVKGNVTRVGNRNFLMCHVHLGHDVVIGDNCILTPSVAVGGHVTLENNVYIGGLSAIHQFVRIGQYSIIGGVAAVLRDVPPYSMFTGSPDAISGINLVGLRRAKFSSDKIQLIKNIYKIVYMRATSPAKAIETLETDLLPKYGEGSEENAIVRNYIAFLKSSDRGISSRHAN